MAGGMAFPLTGGMAGGLLLGDLVGNGFDGGGSGWEGRRRLLACICKHIFVQEEDGSSRGAESAEGRQSHMESHVSSRVPLKRTVLLDFSSPLAASWCPRRLQCTPSATLALHKPLPHSNKACVWLS
ncbi:hypothetical protein BDN70DRAFT_883517 [Pholiota conissans]|uniref:Uncharacterized protein n=1 Tax=Pholiota conissans TaxID=109636 RepID=A0A9P6CWG4_9AGAR|nr:hypothetical protein BDN70DRAFT_883517 [Pholiota conissans]